MSVRLRLTQIGYLTIAMYLYKRLKRRRFRSIGVRDIYKRRIRFGDGHNLIKELRFEDKDFFFIYTRMNVERFEYLLSLVGPLLKKRTMYTAISPSQRLAMTLRFMAAGDSQYTLSFAYRCAQSTVPKFLAETTRAIVYELKPLYLKTPSSEEEWKRISEEFWMQWQFPHCVGAIDGKHIQIQSPKASQKGSQCDGGIFQSSELGLRLSEGSLSLPPPSNLPRTNIEMPYFLVGDAAFPLKSYLMKPYGGRNLPHDCSVYNFRVSRARRVIENCFGILAARWRIFHKPITATIENVEYIVEAAVCLHNFIRKTGDTGVNAEYCPPNFLDRELPDGTIIHGEWRDVLNGENGAIAPGPRQGARNAAVAVNNQRDFLKDFVNGAAALAYQDSLVRFRQGLITADELRTQWDELEFDELQAELNDTN